MNKLLDCISKVVEKAFEESGYDAQYGRVTISNRPDLCEYQCNGAMAAAKKYGKAPFMIADQVQEILAKDPIFEQVESVKPGFLNLNLPSAVSFTESSVSTTETPTFSKYMVCPSAPDTIPFTVNSFDLPHPVHRNSKRVKAESSSVDIFFIIFLISF